jgi:5-deoxy-glucuronate isomerase
MQSAAPTEYIFRNTASHKGRRLSVSPDNSSMRHLHYGRILLDEDVRRVRFETHGREVVLICLSGECFVRVGNRLETIGPFDSVYVPRGSAVEVETKHRADLVECGAAVEGTYPFQVVRYEDVKNDSSLKFTLGAETSTRDLNVLIGKNVRAGRIVAGFTRSRPGHWTSWPPHEHARMLEEMYVFFDMPAPAFGVQFVYTSPDHAEFVGIVREGDAVVMPNGYHPNVSVPGHAINFVWLMAAHREVEDRVFGVVNVEPGFA